MKPVIRPSIISYATGMYSVARRTYYQDDFGNLIPVTFEQLGQASSYIANAHTAQ